MSTGPTIVNRVPRRGLEKYGIWFKYFPGMEKRKQSMEKIFVFPDFFPY